MIVFCTIILTSKIWHCKIKDRCPPQRRRECQKAIAKPKEKWYKKKEVKLNGM
jgi:hypothetical protein